jgi:hypothetical protein
MGSLASLSVDSPWIVGVPTGGTFIVRTICGFVRPVDFKPPITITITVLSTYNGACLAVEGQKQLRYPSFKVHVSTEFSEVLRSTYYDFIRSCVHKLLDVGYVACLCCRKSFRSSINTLLQYYHTVPVLVPIESQPAAATSGS